MGELIRLAKKTWKLTPERREELVREYCAGASTAILSKKYGIAGGNVLCCVRKSGCRVRGPSESHRVLPLNEFAFDVLDDETAYWVGFLMADGCVSDRGGLQVRLSAGDRGHLYKLRAFLGSGHAVTDLPEYRWYRRGHLVVNGPSCHFTVNSVRLARALARWGVRPRKSFTARAPKELAFNRHFWRGVTDGDGSLGLYRNLSKRVVREIYLPRLELCGSRILVGQFRTFVHSVFAPRINKVRSMHSIWRITYDGAFANQLIKYLYAGEITALDRKMAKAQAILLGVTKMVKS